MDEGRYARLMEAAHKDLETKGETECLSTVGSATLRFMVMAEMVVVFTEQSLTTTYRNLRTLRWELLRRVNTDLEDLPHDLRARTEDAG